MRKNSFVFLLIGLLLIGLILVFFIENEEENKLENKNISKQDSGGKNIKDSSEDYEKKVTKNTEEIKPEQYESLRDFVDNVETQSGEIELDEENFGIKTETEKGDEIFTKFTQDFIDDEMFGEGVSKKEAISNIFEAYKKDNIYGVEGTETDSDKKIEFGNSQGHTYSNIINDIYRGEKKLDQVKESYDEIDSRKADELLSFLEELRGNYNKAKERREKMCENYSCDNRVGIIITGEVLDGSGDPIENATVKLLNEEGVSTKTNADGVYEIEYNTYPLSLLRFKALKKGYTDGYYKADINFSENPLMKKYPIRTDFFLSSVDTEKTISDYSHKEPYVFTSSQTRYTLPSKSLHYENGDVFKGNVVNIYMYELHRDDNMTNLMNNDTFGDVYGYVGNVMKTFGMPYIQFFDNKGNELFVYSSNPMTIKNEIYHMDKLYNNADEIYRKITDEDMEFLVEKSSELEGYPIDYDFLIKHKMLRWPAWWVLDRKKGVWENVGHKVLNKDGLVELPFYSIKK